METPSTPRKRYADRDLRLKVLTLRSLGLKYAAIATHLQITIHQVQRACNAGHPTPNKRTGRRPTYTTPMRRDLASYVCTNKRTRRMTWLQLAIEFNTTPEIVKLALKKEGFSRRIARKKPPISETTRQARLAWANEHLNWTPEQWNSILWTDETWVTGKKHTRTWVTRRPGEDFHPDCVEDKIQRYRGWMFWGCFSGALGKGPGLFWEKEWKSINKESYCERIVPLIHGWITLHPELRLMQDNAPGHSAAYTRQELLDREITMIYWPPFSPDLNPIESVWDIMKDYIQSKWEGKNLIYDQLRVAVREAWDSVTQEDLDNLLNEMHDRCQAVITANGMYTKY
jgi:hypothetical protein